jgi:hypothetical protein
MRIAHRPDGAAGIGGLPVVNLCRNGTHDRQEPVLKSKARRGQDRAGNRGVTTGFYFAIL